MLLHFIRGLFVVIIAAVLFVSIMSISEESSISDTATDTTQKDVLVIFIGGLGLSIIVLLIDLLLPRKSLSALAGVFFGLLVGIFLSWASSLRTTQHLNNNKINNCRQFGHYKA